SVTAHPSVVEFAMHDCVHGPRKYVTTSPPSKVHSRCERLRASIHLHSANPTAAQSSHVPNETLRVLAPCRARCISTFERMHSHRSPRSSDCLQQSACADEMQM